MALSAVNFLIARAPAADKACYYLGRWSYYCSGRWSYYCSGKSCYYSGKSYYCSGTCYYFVVSPEVTVVQLGPLDLSIAKSDHG